MALSLGRAGADELLTPREIIRDYLTLLHILKDNPRARFEDVVRGLPSQAQPETPSEVQAEPEAPKNKINIFDIEI